ncbi:MAG TPA: MFS transporter [Candidatus Kapabacteria bacterium]|nr:MFS transporter [Candidatus Kapabacteria bacterium]
MDIQKKVGIKDFPMTYWVVIMFEFFERGAYYGVMSVLSVYMTEILGFTKPEVGAIKGTIQPLLYFLPIISGAVADKMGYRRTLMVAFSLLGIGYFLTSQSTDYAAVFIFLVIMGLGAGTFKPIISGTIAKVTDERNSTLGFGIFYWSINLGAFIFPLVFVPYLKALNWSYVLLMAAVATGLMILPTFFIYKEPNIQQGNKEPLIDTIKQIFSKITIVFMDWRFILFIFIYSWFWILYFQMFDSVLWYVKDFVDATPLDNILAKYLPFVGKFDVEHVTVMNALTIIILQLFISNIVKNTKALPTMLTGIGLGTLGMAILAISSNIWVFLLGIFIFSIGEMTAHPKYISYLGLIAPEDKKATYMGFGFLYGFFGSLIGSFVGAWLYVKMVDNPMIEFINTKLIAANYEAIPIGSKISDAIVAAEKVGLTKQDISQYAYTSELWILFSLIGVLCMLGLLLYQKFILPQATHNK